MKKFLSLVLALVMAMSLVTFTTATAGAKDFTDNSSIRYKEAVDVISAIQIMDGYADASFNPSGTLTRGAAAKIICNMILGPTTASALPTNVAPFPDVPAGSTFAGYIAYCSEHGIISGYADGNFRPADSLSGYAFLKMLLCALGYDQEIEGYQGANWRVNVAKQALGIGLDDGLRDASGNVGELDGSRIVTREEAALYAFNTLQADLVEYDNKTTVSVSGATVTVGGNTFHSKQAATQNTAFDNIDDGQMNNWNIVQFAEEYFNRLVREPKKNAGFTGTGGDSFGRPATTWTYKGVEVGKYPSSLVQTYYADKKISEIYADLKLGGKAENAEVWMNGIHVFNVDIERSKDTKLGELVEADLSTTNNGTVRYLAGVTGGSSLYGITQTEDISTYGTDAFGYSVDSAGNRNMTNGLQYYADKVGDGTILQVFYDEDDNAVVICGMTVYPGEINSVNAAKSTKDAYVAVNYKGTAGERQRVLGTKTATDGTDLYGKKDDTQNEYTISNTSDFNEDDLVWFTYSVREHEIGEVKPLRKVEGVLSRRTSDAITLGGTAYDYSKEKRFDMANGAADLTNNSSYEAYLDDSGRVLWVAEAEFAATQYALVERISVEGSDSSNVYYSALAGDGSPTIDDNPTSWDTNQVRLLTAAGVERTVSLDGSSRYREDDGTGTGTDQIKDEYLAGSIVRFSQNSDGTYRLYSVKLDNQARAAYTFGAEGVGYRTFEITDDHDVNGLYAYDTSVPANRDVANNIASKDIDNSAAAPSVSTDSDTIFVVKDDDTFKVYNGKRNAPIVETTSATAAYVYGSLNSSGTNLKAKLVFVIRGETVSNSKDIVFLSGASRSKMFTASDTDDYYEYNALVNGRQQTILVSADVGTAKRETLKVYNDGKDGAVEFALNPNAAKGDKNWNSVILNNTRYDDDLLIGGWFDSRSLDVVRTVGFKKTSRNDEIKVGTYDKDLDILDNGAVVYTITGVSEETVYVASNANVYYVDEDGNFEARTISSLSNDEDDIVYYTLNDDKEITNLFVCDYEAD